MNAEMVRWSAASGLAGKLASSANGVGQQIGPRLHA